MTLKHVFAYTPIEPPRPLKTYFCGKKYFQKSHGSLGCLIFHDVDLIPLDGRNVYGCVNGPRALHLSAHLENFRYNLPYHDLFGGAVALDESIFEEVNGFSNNFFGIVVFMSFSLFALQMGKNI